MAVKDFRIFFFQQFLLQNLCSAKLIPAVQEIYFFTHSRQINGIFKCHVAAAYDGHGFAAEKCAVTGCAIGNSHARKFFLTRYAKQCMMRARRKDHRFGLQVLFCRANDPFSFLAEELFYLRFHKRNAKLIRMRAELHAHVKSVDAREAKIIIHLVSV